MTSVTVEQNSRTGRLFSASLARAVFVAIFFFLPRSFFLFFFFFFTSIYKTPTVESRIVDDELTCALLKNNIARVKLGTTGLQNVSQN